MSERAKFSGRLGFILAATGSAVGIGNIWRFPYFTGVNGGATFLIIYLAFVVFICFPIMAAEIAIGRKAGLNAYGSFKKLGSQSWGGIGLLGIVACILVLSYYNVISGWAFGYFLEFSFGNLIHENDFSSFYKHFVSDPKDNLIFSIGFMILTAVIVAKGVEKGIEFANKIMMPGLCILLVGMIIYALTLPGAMKGLEFYLVPDVSEITKHTIFDGVRQAFFSLSLGMGCMITYGSYLQKNENIMYSAAVITIADTAVALLAGLMIFPLVFSSGMSPTEGPALVFMVLPQIFHDMGPVAGRILGSCFFLMLCFAALASTISMLEVPVAYFVDEKKMSRKKVVTWLAIGIFLLGIPSLLSNGTPGFKFLKEMSFYRCLDFMTFISDLSDIMLTVGGFLLCLFVDRRWRLHNMHEEIQEGDPAYMKSGIHTWINFSIRFLCPISLGIISIALILEKFFGLENIF